MAFFSRIFSQLSKNQNFSRQISKNFRYFSVSYAMTGPKVAVVLSGSGVYDGSEIHESVATLATLSRLGATIQCYAPDENQMHVVDHTKGAPMEGETRNVMIESARISRGNIKPLTELNSDAADAVVFPGGFGAAKNLSDFGVKGAEMSVKSDVERILNNFHSAKKPIALCCISPIIAAKVFGAKNVQLTLGKSDDGSGKWPYAGSIDAAKSFGANIVEKGVDEVSVDETNKIVTSPAFMYEGKFHEIQDGVAKMIEALFKLIK